MSSFTTQELKDLYHALNMCIDWYSSFDNPNTFERLLKLQDKIEKLIDED